MKTGADQAMAGLTLGLISLLCSASSGCGAPGAADSIDQSREIGVRWELLQLDGEPADRHGSLLINPRARRLSGNGACNAFAGRFALEDGSLDIELDDHRIRRCIRQHDAVEHLFVDDRLATEFEHRFITALDTTDAFTIGHDGTRLSLLNEAGRIVAEFRRAED